LAACVWCGVTTDILVDDSLDAYPEDPLLVEPICVQIIVIGNLAWYGTNALFWFAAASSIWGRAALEHDTVRFYCGLPNSLAAAGIIVMQIALGTFWLILQAQLSLNDKDTENYLITAGSVVFHYATLMTAFFAHNLIWTMARKPKSEEEKAKEEEDQENPFNLTIMDTNEVSSNDADDKALIALEAGLQTSKSPADRIIQPLDSGSGFGSQASETSASGVFPKHNKNRTTIIDQIDHKLDQTILAIQARMKQRTSIV
jgi:hypothetical protein